MSQSIDRRTWIKRCSACVAASGLLAQVSCAPGSEKKPATPKEPEYNAYFGDIHNHNCIGLAKGSLERTFDIARSHLDFVSAVPHAYWHDIPVMEQGKQQKWLDGFEVTRRRWPEVQEWTRNTYKPGQFVTFHGYEWHSSGYGDYVILFPGDDSPLTHFDTLKELQEFALAGKALLIPHHPAYLVGNRGANTQYWDHRVTPLLEIYSEHGNAESDSGPWDYIRHSMGGRWTPNTLQAILAAGHRVGVLASSDNHLGYPGAYGEGLAGILAPELTRDSLFDALRRRRTFAVTGDRIALDFRLNGASMGQELPFAGAREIFASVSGWDRLERVEVLRNNRVIHREFPGGGQVSSVWSEPVAVKVEYGWGPWADLNIPRTCDWRMKVRLEGGKLAGLQPCFQSGPFDEERRNLISEKGPDGFSLQSYTSRQGAFAERPTNAVVLKIQGGPETLLDLEISRPSAQSVRKTLAQLLESDEVVFTGPFPDESLLIHRLVPGANTKTSFTITDTGSGDSDDWYYLRAEQRNGHLAWSSPIWVDKRA